MKNGKLPLSKKSNYVTPSEAFGGGELDIQPEVAAYLKEKGLGYKWMSTRHLQLNGGRHKRGWTVFLIPEELKKKIPANPFGRAPDGTISVGDLVLGVKPLIGSGVTVESHKRVLAQAVQDKTRQAFGTGPAAISILEDDDQ